MRRLALAAIVVVLLWLLAASSAIAGQDSIVAALPMTTPYSSVTVRASLRIAAEFHGRQAACPGGVRVFVEDLSPWEVAAFGEQPGCRIWLDADWLAIAGRGDYNARIATCSVLVHEYGHLLGLSHALRRRSIMRGGENLVTVRGCYERFVPRGVTAAQDAADWGPRTWATRLVAPGVVRRLGVLWGGSSRRAQDPAGRTTRGRHLVGCRPLKHCVPRGVGVCGA
jgi:hypothetical protein